MTPKFWIKTAVYRWTPGGYGYYRYLPRSYDPGYVHERDKHPVRRKHYSNEGWKQQKTGGVAYRDYADYDEYVTHQKRKFDEILKLSGGFRNSVIAAYRLRFYRRFRYLVRLLPKTAYIACARATGN